MSDDHVSISEIIGISSWIWVYNKKQVNHLQLWTCPFIFHGIEKSNKRTKALQKKWPFFILYLYISLNFTRFFFFYIILFLPLFFCFSFAPLNDIMHKRNFDSSSSSYHFYFFYFQFLFCFLYIFCVLFFFFVLFFLFYLCFADALLGLLNVFFLTLLFYFYYLC